MSTFQTLILSGLLTILLAGNALAADNRFYVQFNAGAAFAPSFSLSRSNCGIDLCSTSFHKEQYNPGYVGSVALGYRIANSFRIEVEGLYQSNDNDKYANSIDLTGIIGHIHRDYSGKISGERARTAFLMNGYYDFVNSTSFTPFITAGLGGYHMRLNSQDSSIENDLDFAWQAGAGVNYRLNDQISFDLKYRYFGGANAELIKSMQYGQNAYTITQFRDVGEHQVMAGIRIGF